MDKGHLRSLLDPLPAPSRSLDALYPQLSRKVESTRRDIKLIFLLSKITCGAYRLQGENQDRKEKGIHSVEPCPLGQCY